MALDLVMKFLAALTLIVASTNAIATDVVSVTIGTGGPDIDACPSFAELNKPTILRNGPDSGFVQVIQLERGSKLHVCGHTKSGRWTSVVLAQDGMLDCKVSTPVPRPQFYRGPCMSGWVPTSSVQIVAG